VSDFEKAIVSREVTDVLYLDTYIHVYMKGEPSSKLKWVIALRRRPRGVTAPCRLGEVKERKIEAREANLMFDVCCLIGLCRYLYR
jgi:hypothetical protein